MTLRHENLLKILWCVSNLSCSEGFSEKNYKETLINSQTVENSQMNDLIERLYYVFENVWKHSVMKGQPNFHFYFDCLVISVWLCYLVIVCFFLQEEDTSLLNVTPDGHVLQVCWHHLCLLKQKHHWSDT